MTHRSIRLSLLTDILQCLLHDRTLPIPQKRPITFPRQSLLSPLSLVILALLQFLDLLDEWFHRFFEFIIVAQDRAVSDKEGDLGEFTLIRQGGGLFGRDVEWGDCG